MITTGMKDAQDKVVGASKKSAQHKQIHPSVSESSHKSSQVQLTVKKHPDPTRYGDWEVSGRCIDF